MLLLKLRLPMLLLRPAAAVSREDREAVANDATLLVLDVMPTA